MPSLEELRGWLRAKGAHSNAGKKSGADATAQLRAKNRYTLSVDGTDAVLKRGFGIYDGEAVSQIIRDKKGRRALKEMIRKESDVLSELASVFKYQADKVDEERGEMVEDEGWDPDRVIEDEGGADE